MAKSAHIFLSQEKENLSKLQSLVARAGGWSISRNLNPAMGFDERVRVVQGIIWEIDHYEKISPKISQITLLSSES